MGKERILMTMEACGVEIPQPAGIDAFIAFIGDEAQAAALKADVKSQKRRQVGADGCYGKKYKEPV